MTFLEEEKVFQLKGYYIVKILVSFSKVVFRDLSVEGSHLFVPATQNQNNPTETVLIKSLLVPLALACY